MERAGVGGDRLAVEALCGGVIALAVEEVGGVAERDGEVGVVLGEGAAVQRDGLLEPRARFGTRPSWARTETRLSAPIGGAVEIRFNCCFTDSAAWNWVQGRTVEGSILIERNGDGST